MPKSPVNEEVRFTTEEAAVLTHRAVVSVEAVFENEADLRAVAEVFRALQAEARTGVLTGLHIKRIDGILTINLVVCVVEAKVGLTVKRNIGSSSRASGSKGAHSGERN